MGSLLDLTAGYRGACSSDASAVTLARSGPIKRSPSFSIQLQQLVDQRSPQIPGEIMSGKQPQQLRLRFA